MKIIVFGATGGTGKQLVEQALAQGHEVRVLVRDRSKLLLQHKNLDVTEGDALDARAVALVLVGGDVVICTLGKSNILDGSKLRANATRLIIDAMGPAEIRRLICLSGMGAGDSYAMLPFHYRYILVPLLMRRLYADHNLQEEHIKNSDLDWVIVRPGNLTDGDWRGNYAHGFKALAKNMTIKISRADTADFMLKQLDDNRYLHQTPCLSY